MCLPKRMLHSFQYCKPAQREMSTAALPAQCPALSATLFATSISSVQADNRLLASTIEKLDAASAARVMLKVREEDRWSSATAALLAVHAGVHASTRTAAAPLQWTRTAQFQKPQVVDPVKGEPVAHISISHDGAVVVCAASKLATGDVGIDVLALDRARQLCSDTSAAGLRTVARRLPAAAAAQIAAATGDERAQLFGMYWTLMESVAKMYGLSLFSAETGRALLTAATTMRADLADPLDSQAGSWEESSNANSNVGAGSTNSCSSSGTSGSAAAGQSRPVPRDGCGREVRFVDIAALLSGQAAGLNDQIAGSSQADLPQSTGAAHSSGAGASAAAASDAASYELRPLRQIGSHRGEGWRGATFAFTEQDLKPEEILVQVAAVASRNGISHATPASAALPDGIGSRMSAAPGARGSGRDDYIMTVTQLLT